MAVRQKCSTQWYKASVDYKNDDEYNNTIRIGAMKLAPYA